MKKKKEKKTGACVSMQGEGGRWRWGGAVDVTVLKRVNM